MTADEEQVAYSKEDILQVLRYLNTIVVSLDRIGSTHSTIGQQGCDKLLVEFINEWQIFKKLATARSILSEPFSRELGVDDMDELENAMQNVPYWSWSKRTPPD